MAQPAVPQSGVEGETGERPERQLADIVIELGGAEIEIVHAVDDQDRGQRAGCADQRPRRQPHRHESDDHGDLAERIDGGIGAEQLVGGLDQPPRQRRQLVVAELPFAAVNQRLDHVDRQVEVEERGQRRPDQPVHDQEAGENRLRAAFHRVDQSGHGHCVSVRRCARSLSTPSAARNRGAGRAGVSQP